MVGAQLFAMEPALVDVWLGLVRDVPGGTLALTANAYAFLGMQVCVDVYVYVCMYVYIQMWICSRGH